MGPPLRIWGNGCTDYTVMAAFYSQAYNQEDTLYLLPGEDRRYINEKIRRGCLPKTGRLPRRYSFTGYIAVCGSFLYTATFCPHQRYFRRVGTRTLILIGFAIWSFIPASSATCLSSEKAFAVIATMGIFAFGGSSIRRIFFAAS